MHARQLFDKEIGFYALLAHCPAEWIMKPLRATPPPLPSGLHIPLSTVINLLLSVFAIWPGVKRVKQEEEDPEVKGFSLRKKNGKCSAH